jgi:hypothetical protein
MKRDDYELVANGLDCNTGSKVFNIALTRAGDSVQLHWTLRVDPDDIGYAVVMTRVSTGAGRGAHRARGGVVTAKRS